MKISVVTPSVRPEMIPVVLKCLERQTWSEFFDWVIVSPRFLVPEFEKVIPVKKRGFGVSVLAEPEKKDGDYYSLNKAWNSAFKILTDSKLIISIVDGLWFPPDTLEKLWIHYQNKPKALVGGIGHQYDRVENGKPEHMVWRDPRARMDFGTFYEISPRDLEWCIASIPKQALIDIGGIDEKWDQYAALSEKEACFRMDKLGYKFYIDQAIEYRAIKHDRLSKEWDEKFNQGCEYFSWCLKEIQEGRRLHLDYL